MSIVPWLNETLSDFPPVDSALVDPNGLLAIGGDLSTQRLIEAYRQGIFPWFDDEQPILWWSPNPRAVLFPEDLVLSRSLRKRLKRHQFSVYADRSFTEVMRYCASVPRAGQNGTWITTDMLGAYQQLFEMGIAHSVEAWQDGKLVGGLYGVAIGGVFFGESMFSLVTDASKVAFAHLVRQLQRWHFTMIDCQVSNPHLLSLGAKEIPRVKFKHLLDNNLSLPSDDLWPGIWDDLF